MTLENVMAELKAKGNDGLKKILLKHGIKEPFFGVKVEDLKVIQKKIKNCMNPWIHMQAFSS